MTKLDQPIKVGEISGPESAEVKALNGLVTHAQAEAQRWQNLLAICINQRTGYLRSLATDRGLDPKNVYGVDVETGVILQTESADEPSDEQSPTPMVRGKKPPVD